MARYIDADKLIKKIYPMGIGDGMYTINAKAVKFAIDNTPTADVVPRAEVEELKAIIADHKASEERLEELYSNTKTEVAREIFEEMECLFSHFCYPRLLGNGQIETARHYGLHLNLDEFAKLKKKYTEVQSDGYDG